MIWRRLAFALYPKPWGLGRFGRDSVVMFPRRIEGAPSIFIGSDVVIQSGGWIAAIDHWRGQTFRPQIEIGDHVRIGHQVMITAVEQVSLGDGCLLSEQVFISDHVHQALPGPIPPTRQPLVPRGAVRIGRHCFLGIRSVIMGGVILGDYCVVGANSVVTRSFPAGSVIAGVPARLIKTLPIADAVRAGSVGGEA